MILQTLQDVAEARELLLAMVQGRYTDDQNHQIASSPTAQQLLAMLSVGVKR